ncbi:MAG: hypothetical protein COT35_04235 [Nitrospirae bacterium CG08_land_8_20_14_0_20_52_24]|nr:MAG: hypothetical protein AUK29_00050 [Nitrospirae bacterium CG2_30_53_67]PIS37780.1 MAG: hypothetical protein COT35_04235 [Nitrospirae bacterium CG08_land_8_20_14_0_20_52_24]PIV85286.1 MAG: hypothetical protein COW52_03105 [Nitrospirae bacterium CG17_big_fil_post_rev_8_21_14_2_50_50_9]PIX86247.1 MAG: hypothetical protein COZ32_04315 [Nitrospirae bacterium CG_4_10_14_3_um_filter_53_41]
MGKNEGTTGVRETEENQDHSFWKRYGPDILLGILIIYVILLGIGTYAELTHNESILNWWIFK